MIMQEFGTTGEKVSRFCLGCMLMGTAMDDNTSQRVLNHFTEAGGNFLDTANCYAWWMGSGEFVGDESENVLGKWMQERKNRHEIFLATKVGGRLKNPHNIRGADGIPEWDRVPGEYEGLSAGVIRKGIEDSLRRLKTDYIDLYYTHVYDKNTPIEETLSVLNQLVKEGKVRHIGCSNLTVAQLKEAREISKRLGVRLYTAVQQEYSYLHPKQGVDTGIVEHVDAGQLEYIKANPDITLMAYSPLLKGIYNSEEKRKRYYNWSNFDSTENARKLEIVDKLSRELGVTGNQLVLAWLLRQEPKLIPILGFSNEEQYRENIAALTITLTDGQLAEMGR
ncbi:aldo/keto reductase [Acetanaerobacterium elongatum]|uniref:Predicted oxidoreductase n=1 Tax=Acetanaerobacterium elongatum TaxID=258515 RepID=A0A1H0CWP8_9FIRM|nr:aldo/keto reductase [Acetanaerobacterium elongatum]SDN62226.1 Predicted oxidoreductase [Acetanaerobacterium elongatum]